MTDDELELRLEAGLPGVPSPYPPQGREHMRLHDSAIASTGDTLDAAITAFDHLNKETTST